YLEERWWRGEVTWYGKSGVASDALLYRATVVLTVGGTAYAINLLAMAAFPKKQN
uniref:Uncharacterized protein n=1 Tax=Mus spicilegus TaxID=10103 RepID=A0A8C6HZC8_MUSSI